MNHHWVPKHGVKNLTALARCDRDCQEHMVWHFTRCDPDYGRRIGEGLGISADQPAPEPVGARLAPWREATSHRYGKAGPDRSAQSFGIEEASMDQDSAAAQPGPENSAGSRWQHLVIEIGSDEEEHQAPPLQERLDLMGQEGWELVALTSTTYRPAPGGMGAFGERPYLLLVFKRPLASVPYHKQAEGGWS